MAEKVDTAGDWPVQATTTIVNVVGQVRDKTTGPIITAARAVVYGTLAAILAIVAAVLGFILLIRVLSIPVEELLGPDHIWVVYLILGIPLTGVGVFFLKKAAASPVDR